jgi:hypothetical protein
MKKLFLVLLPFAALLIYFGCQQLPTGPEEPVNGVTLFNGGTGAVLSIDLIAGQDIKVGNVTVWNDEFYLYVEYNITDPEWCLEETHLAVATTLAGIPQTKKGNPIPGQFPYKNEELGCVTIDPYAILLSDIDGYTECGDALVIAAHAVVKNLANGTNETFEIGSGMAGVNTTVLERRAGNVVGFTVVNEPAELAWEPGSSYPNDGPNDSGWEQWSLWDSRLNSSVFRPSGTDVADWIWESYRVNDPVAGTVLYMETKFELCEPGSATLYVATDNGFEVFLNGVSLGDHGVFGEWRDSDLYQQYVPQDGWDNVQSYTLNNLVAGTNTLRLEVANEHLDTDDSPNNLVGTESNNPGAVIFLISGSSTCYQFETAWGEGPGFPGNNWATYIPYTTTCCNEWVVYGTSLGGSGIGSKIYQIDLATLTAAELYNTGLNTGDGNWPNGNAYDAQNNRLYYSVKPNKLYFYDFVSSQVDATNGNPTPGDVACGSFYNGKYYYIPQNSDKLYEVTLNPADGKITTVVNIQTYSGKTFSFGDVVVSLDGSVLYGSSAVSGTGKFWSISLSDYTYTEINNMAHMQLAYGSDGSLYGHDAGNAHFYLIDEVAGTRSDLGVLTTGPSGGKFTDLASGPQCQ